MRTYLSDLLTLPPEWSSKTDRENGGEMSKRELQEKAV